MKEIRTWYQSFSLLSIIGWCWTFILLFLSLIILMELSYLSLTSIILLVLFVLMFVVEVYFRQLKVNNNKIKIFSILHLKGKPVYFNDIISIKNKWIFTFLTIKKEGLIYHLILLPKFQRLIKQKWGNYNKF